MNCGFVKCTWAWWREREINGREVSPMMSDDYGGFMDFEGQRVKLEGSARTTLVTIHLDIGVETMKLLFCRKVLNCEGAWMSWAEHLNKVSRRRCSRLQLKTAKNPVKASIYPPPRT